LIRIKGCKDTPGGTEREGKKNSKHQSQEYMCANKNCMYARTTGKQKRRASTKSARPIPNEVEELSMAKKEIGII
jgi:hypothetical protein